MRNFFPDFSSCATLILVRVAHKTPPAHTTTLLYIAKNGINKLELRTKIIIKNMYFFPKIINMKLSFGLMAVMALAKPNERVITNKSECCREITVSTILKFSKFTK